MIKNMMDEKDISLLDQKWHATHEEKEKIKAEMGFLGFFKRRAYEKGYTEKLERKECPFCGSGLEIKLTRIETNTHIAEYMEWEDGEGYYSCKGCNRVVGSYSSTEKTFG